jgi:hypothetical protein
MKITVFRDVTLYNLVDAASIFMAEDQAPLSDEDGSNLLHDLG